MPLFSRELADKLILLGVAIIVGWFFWFLLIPFLNATVFFTSAPSVLESLFDGAVLGLLWTFSVSLVFWLFGGGS